MRSVNRTADWLMTRTVQAVGREMGLKRSDLVNPHRFIGSGRGTRPAIYAEHTGEQNLTASVHIAGGRIPLVFFGARQIKRGVSYRIGARGRTVAKGAFLAEGRKGAIKGARSSRDKHAGVKQLGTSGHTGVWKRSQGARHVPPNWHALPIFQLLGPSVPYVAGKNEALRKAINVDGAEQLAKNLRSQLDLLLGRGHGYA